MSNRGGSPEVQEYKAAYNSLTDLAQNDCFSAAVHAAGLAPGVVEVVTASGCTPEVAGAQASCEEVAAGERLVCCRGSGRGAGFRVTQQCALLLLCLGCVTNCLLTSWYLAVELGGSPQADIVYNVALTSVLLASMRCLVAASTCPIKLAPSSFFNQAITTGCSE